MNEKIEKIFSDDTSTGQKIEELRSVFRVSIAAKTPKNRDFQNYSFLLSNIRKIFNLKGEIKSELIIKICEQDNTIKKKVYEEVYPSTIIILDLLKPFRESLKKSGFLPVKFLNIFKGNSISSGFKKHIFENLRQISFLNSLIVRLEDLKNRAQDNRQFRKRKSIDLVNKDILRGIQDRHFREFVSKISIVYCDAFDLKISKEIFNTLINEYVCIDESIIARSRLHYVLEPDYILDKGSKNVFDILKEVHNETKTIFNDFQKNKLGILDEGDSKDYIGIQIADLSAGIARKIFEENYLNKLNTLKAATEVRRYFKKVLFNSNWL